MRDPAITVHPVQTVDHKGGYAPQVVTLRAYEVYCQVHNPQEAMVTGNCRGGFGTGELIAFLYARSFPPQEWSDRVREAIKGAVNL